MKQATQSAAVVVLLLCLAGLAFWMFSSPELAAQKSALANRTLATQTLATYLAQQFPGQKALVVGNPFTQKKGERAEIYAFEKAGLRGLRQGFGHQMTLAAVAYPELRPEYYQNPEAIPIDPQTTTPLSFLVAENSFDRLARAHPDCSLLVSLIGLPANLNRVELWQQATGPKLALLLPDLRIVGDRAAILKAFQSGKIVAAVLNRPGGPPEASPPTKSAATEFALRYLLVTVETVEELMRLYPPLFGSSSRAPARYSQR